MTDAAELRRRTQELLAAHPPATTDRLDFLRARFDAGLAWVHFPEGLGGLGLPRSLQVVVDAELEAAGAPDNDPRRIGIGLGMAAPTILKYGTEEQKQRFLRPLWTGEEVWCQLGWKSTSSTRCPYRSWVRSSGRSRQVLAIGPIMPPSRGSRMPPMATRSLLRVVWATRQPSPTSPRRRSSGMRTSVRNTSLNSASPVIWRSGRTSTPGACMSSAK